MYYKLDPDARYSDGIKVKAKDFMFGLFIRLSDNITDPYSKQYYREQIANVTVYSDSILSVSLPEEKPMLPYFTSVVPLAPPHFYEDYGPDYE